MEEVPREPAPAISVGAIVTVTSRWADAFRLVSLSGREIRALKLGMYVAKTFIYSCEKFHLGGI